MGKLRDIINARAKGKEVEYKLNVEETLPVASAGGGRGTGGQEQVLLQ